MCLLASLTLLVYKFLGEQFCVAGNWNCSHLLQVWFSHKNWKSGRRIRHINFVLKSLLVDVFYYKTRSKASEKIFKGWPIGTFGWNVFLAADMPKWNKNIFSFLECKSKHTIPCLFIVLLGANVNLLFKGTSEFIGYYWRAAELWSAHVLCYLHVCSVKLTLLKRYIGCGSRCLYVLLSWAVTYELHV